LGGKKGIFFAAWSSPILTSTFCTSGSIAVPCNMELGWIRGHYISFKIGRRISFLCLPAASQRQYRKDRSNILFFSAPN
jgi:hypothetical protein